MSSKPAPLFQLTFRNLLAAFLSLLIPIVGLLFGLVAAEFRHFVYEGDLEKARHYALDLTQALRPEVSWEEAAALLHLRRPESRLDRIAVVAPEGQVVLDTSGRHQGSRHPLDHISEAEPLYDLDARLRGYLLVGTMIEPALAHAGADFMSRLLWLFAAFLAGAIGTALVLSLTLSRSLSQPIGHIARAVRAGPGHLTSALQGHNLGRRPALEIVSLAADLSNLEHRLLSAEEAKTRLLADASHELRTPLTVIRGSLEGMLEGVLPLERSRLEAVYKETLRLQSISESLKRLEDWSSQPLALEACSLKELFESVQLLFSGSLAEKAQILELEAPRPDRIHSNPEVLKQILVNFVSNAHRYAGHAARIRLSAELKAEGAVIRVDDDGPGIPEADRARVLERFVRLDPSRSSRSGGQGLGLSIAAAGVRRLGGRLCVSESPLGGARFEVTLPPSVNPDVQGLPFDRA